MKGDFSRLTFDPGKHYSGVRMQQGRVQLDADWNEQVDIFEHRIATEIKDFIGQSGTPAGDDGDGGFALDTNDQGIVIGSGRYYVDGLLLENEMAVSFTEQPNYPGVVLPTEPGQYLGYLDVWQRHISAVEDPDLREPALGGPDTATRIKNVWHVTLLRLGSLRSKISSADFRSPHWRGPADGAAITTGRLSARVGTQGATLENQLYRVEIHQGGNRGPTPDEWTEAPSFKWSRDNGAIAARASVNGQQITLINPARDAQEGFAIGQWIELTDERRTLASEPGILAELAAVDGNELTVSSWPDGAPELDNDIVVRRWDSPGGIAIAEGWVQLEDGIEVAFETSDVSYRSGDYWLIPARNLTGDIEWPRDTVDGTTSPRPPHGVLHHFCSLALLEFDGKRWRVSADLRFIFRPLATDLVSKAGDTITGPLTIDAALEVAGDIGVGGSLRAREADRALHVAGPLAIDGDVGIGTTEPSAKLTVDPQGPGGIVIGNPSTSGGGYTSLSLAISAASDGHAVVQSIRASGSEYGNLAFNPDGGNVGIGTTTPVAKLEVSGDLKVSGTIVQEEWIPFELDAQAWDLVSPDLRRQGAYPGYFRDTIGTVHLRGFLATQQPQAKAIGTLPPGYRPQFRQHFIVYAVRSADVGEATPFNTISIDTDGSVIRMNQGIAQLALDGITFRAHNAVVG